MQICKTHHSSTSTVMLPFWKIQTVKYHYQRQYMLSA